jgi:hypothetical protein
MLFVSQTYAMICNNEHCNSWCQANEYPHGACTPFGATPDKQTCQCFGEIGNWPRD